MAHNLARWTARSGLGEPVLLQRPRAPGFRIAHGLAVDVGQALVLGRHRCDAPSPSAEASDDLSNNQLTPYSANDSLDPTITYLGLLAMTGRPTKRKESPRRTSSTTY